MNERKKIQEELGNFSSTLSGAERHNPFNVPKGYFEQMQAQVFDRLAIGRDAHDDIALDYFEKLQQNVLQKIAEEELNPLPDQVLRERVQNPFLVPEGYFETSRSAILRHLFKEKGKVLKLWRNNVISLAASITGLIAIVWILTVQDSPDSFDALSGISSSEMIQYLEDNISEIDYGEIEKIAEKEQIDVMESLDINPDDIESYLEEEMDDLNIEELL